MTTIKTVAVTGATGFVGRAIVAELLKQGYNVRALVRSRVKAREVLPRPTPNAATLTLVEGDIHDDRSPAELVAGAQACIHLIGIIREERGGVTFHRMHVASTRVITEACKAAGVNRYLQMSALGVRDDADCAYRTTKWDAEQIVRRSGLDWTIFRPGLIHGPGSSFLEMAARWCKGEAPPYFFLPYFRGGQEDTSVPLGGVNYRDPVVQPVAVDDVASAFVRALSREQSVGETYNLVGSEQLTWPQMLVELRDNIHGANTNLQPWGVPADLAALQALGASYVGLGGLLPFDHGMAVMGGQDSVSETKKVESHLELKARPFRASFRAYAGTL
ncbi:MAG: SDR family NAD(P)-dependent oxidoreductase [Phycisphaerales bacterium]|nr:SDR family NAD(P)-dependent oxidoreductase [Phycisphaerales bacterium]